MHLLVFFAERVRTKGFDLFSKLGNFLSKAWCFCAGYPFKGYPFRVNAKIFEQQLDHFVSGLGFVITYLVMTFIEMSPHHHNPVGAFFQGVNHQVRVDHA